MSAVYNNQDDLSASIEAKKLADEIIAAQSKGKAENLDIKSKLENLDSVEIEQLLGILHETFDIGETHSTDGIDPAVLQDLKKKLEDLIKKIKDHPELYVPSLCVDGKISVDLAAKFCAGQAALLGELVKSPSTTTTSSSTATSTAPATTDSTATNTATTTESQDHNYSSYLSMAKVVGDVSYDLSFIEAKVTEDSSLQTKWLAEENEALINSAQSQLDDVNKQIAHIEHEKRRARHLRKTMGILTHVLGSVCVVLSIISCNPVLIAIAVTAFADQETSLATGKGGFIQQGTNAFADLLILSASGYGIKLSPEAAKIIAAVVVTAVIACACGAASESAATGILVGAFLAQSSGLFTDIANAQIAAEHDDPNGKRASDIQMGWAIGGAAICLVASLGAAAAISGGSEEEIEATTLEEVTAQVQQMMKDLMSWAFKITETSAEQWMTGAMAAGTGTEIGLMITQSVLSGVLAENYTQTAREQRKLDISMADLDITKVSADQIEAVADTQASVAQKEVSSLAESLNSYIYYVNQAALGSVIQV